MITQQIAGPDSLIETRVLKYETWSIKGDQIVESEYPTTPDLLRSQLRQSLKRLNMTVLIHGMATSTCTRRVVTVLNELGVDYKINIVCSIALTDPKH